MAIGVMNDGDVIADFDSRTDWRRFLTREVKKLWHQVGQTKFKALITRVTILGPTIQSGIFTNMA